MRATMHFQKVHQLPLATTKRRLPCKRCRRQCTSRRYISSLWPPQSAACHAKDAGDNAFPKGTSAPSGHHKAPPAMQMPATMHFQKVHWLPLATTKRRLPCKRCRRRTSAPSAHHKAPPAMQKTRATMHFQKVHQLPLATTKRRLPCKRCRRQCISKRYISPIWPPQSAACHAKDAGVNVFPKGTAAPSGHHKAPPATQKMLATMHFQKVHQLPLATTKRRLPCKRCRRQCISKRYISSLWPPQSAACHAKDAGDNAFPKGTSALLATTKRRLPCKRCRRQCMSNRYISSLWSPQSAACHAKDAGDNAFPKGTSAPSAHHKAPPAKRCGRQCISKRYISSLWPPQSAACHAKDAGDNALPEGTSAPSGHHKAQPATQKMPATMHFQKVHQLPLATTKRRLPCKRCRRQCISKRYIGSLWPPQKAPPAMQKMPATMHIQKVHQLPLPTTKRRLPRKRCRRQCICKRYISSLWPPQSAACHAKDAGDNAFPKGTSAPSGHHKAPPAMQKMPATMHFQNRSAPSGHDKAPPAMQKMPATMHFQKVHQLPLATTKRRLPCKRCRRQCISKRYISSLWPPQSAACHAKDAGDNAFPKYISSLWPRQSAACHAKDAGDNAFPKGASAPSGHHKAPPATQKMPATMHFQNTSAHSGHHKAPPAMQKMPATTHFQKLHQLPLATTKRRLPCKRCQRELSKRYISSLWPPQSAACHAKDASENVFPKGTSAPSGHHKAPPATQKMPATMHFQKVHQLPLATTKRSLPRKRCRRQCISKRYISSLWPPQSAACHAKDAGDNAFPKGTLAPSGHPTKSAACHAKDAGDNAFPKGTSAPSGHHKAPPATQKMPATMHLQKVHQLPLATTKRRLPCKRCRRQCISKRYISSLWPPQSAACHAKDAGDNAFPK